MKTNELRLGNYILVDCVMFKEELKVTEIYPNGVFAKTKYPDDDMPEIGFIKEEDIEPIELTEEVLLKIGFKKERQLISNLFYLDYETDVDNIIRVKYVIYPKAPSLLKITTSQCGNYECFEFMKRGIKYLHELQNAYFILTGKELEVEL